MSFSQRRIKTYIRLVSPCLSGLVVTSAIALSSPAQISAQTLYVKPTAEVVVRRGQGNEYKIVGMVKDGASVELVEESDDYSRIRLENGKEGWILKRFLSPDPPLGKLVEQLQQEKEAMLTKVMETEEKLDEVTELLNSAESELAAGLIEKETIARDLDILRRDTADVVTIKNNLEKTQEENTELTQRLARIEQENSDLKQDKAINWFLAGAGALLLGVLIGRLPKPAKRRKSSLLS